MVEFSMLTVTTFKVISVSGALIVAGMRGLKITGVQGSVLDLIFQTSATTRSRDTSLVQRFSCFKRVIVLLILIQGATGYTTFALDQYGIEMPPVGERQTNAH